MFGLNPILGAEFGDGAELKVHSVFHTIQGEGPYFGVPAVFIRLSGCNLACTFCDTEFDEYFVISIDDILKKVTQEKADYQKTNLIVITGGEPFRQNISPLCKKLIDLGYKIQLESNGTIFREIPPEVEIVCSPKVIKNKQNGHASYYDVNPRILKQSIAVKFLISSMIDGYSDIAEVGQTEYSVPVYVQPMDEYDDQINRANVQKAMDVAKKHGAILSLQLHKILDIE